MLCKPGTDDDHTPADALGPAAGNIGLVWHTLLGGGYITRMRSLHVSQLMGVMGLLQPMLLLRSPYDITELE